MIAHQLSLFFRTQIQIFL